MFGRLLWWGILATAAAAVVLRVWHINSLGFNSDEAVYAGQAAAISRVPVLADIFPIFRAHPLLFQFSLSLLYHGSASDLIARLLAAGFGLATIALSYRLGTELFGRSVGLVTMGIMALMPYHVVVSRQALLDVPETFFATVTFLLLARFAATNDVRWIYATAGALGLTFLSKETAIVLLPAIYAFLALTPEFRLKLRQMALSIVIFLAVVSPFFLAIKLGGGQKTSQSFLVWQLFRPSNHAWTFYLSEVPRAMGMLVVGLAVAAFIGLRRDADAWKRRLLAVWITVPFLFFQIWPVKGFQYLLPVAPAVAILAARAIVQWPIREHLRVLGREVTGTAMRLGLVALVALSLLVPSVRAITTTDSSTFLAGSGGVPGGRDAGLWLREHAPSGSTVLAIGPSMANILQFYGQRRALGLSVSPNPLHRNPAYDPVVNPDLELRSGDIQYVAWDSFSAARSPFFSDKLLRYAHRYGGRVVHSESVARPGADGPVLAPVIVIYEVRP
jgi:4-amino-4-deoxy-L-arabinose transferase-like glycosyltransferase